MQASLFAAAISAWITPALAFGANWSVDASHSSARFSVRHMMVGRTHGKLGPITGTVQFDERDVTKAKIDVSIDVTGIDTDDAKRDAHLKGTDFFDVETFPSMTFKSKRIRRAKKGKLAITGDLTIRGKTQEVTLSVEGPTAVVKDPWGNWRIGATATTTINRKDFGVSWSQTMDNGGLVVGDEVEITIDVELLTKDRKAT